MSARCALQHGHLPVAAPKDWHLVHLWSSDAEHQSLALDECAKKNGRQRKRERDKHSGTLQEVPTEREM